MTYDPAEVLILVPILGRPHLIEPLVRNVENVTPDEAMLVFLPDDNDTESVDMLNDAGASYLPSRERGWAAKINDALRVWEGHRYVFCCADDVIFHDGWLDAVMHVMGGVHVLDRDEFAIVSVVGTLDNLTANVMAGEHATHFMVDRHYITDPGGVIDQGPGSFLNEQYTHNYVDTEFIQTAIRRGVFAPSKAIVEHAHHLNGLAPYDETYRIGDASMAADGELYASRAHLWAG